MSLLNIVLAAIIVAGVIYIIIVLWGLLCEVIEVIKRNRRGN